MSVTFKICFTLPSNKQEFRRFSTQEKEILPALISFLESTYSQFYQPPLRFVIQYDDGEDLLTVSSELELQEGLSYHQQLNGPNAVWKLMCRFDENVNQISGITTPLIPQTPSSIGCPSPSIMQTKMEELTIEPTVVEQKVEEVVAEVTKVVEEKSPLLTQSVRSDDEEVQVELSSDDEYVRIEDESSEVQTKPIEPKVETPTAAAPTTTPTPTSTSSTPTSSVTPPIALPVVETTPATDNSDVAMFIDSHGSRHDCRLCPKKFMSQNFAAAHIRNRHKEAYTTVTAPVEVKKTVTEESKSVTSTPTVEESTPTSASVEIADVTGHHEHVQPTPEPTTAVVATVATVAPTTNAPVVHSGITCDGCGQSPIVGIRYNCTTCIVPGGFDLCSACESAGNKHPSNHILLKMRVPAHVPVGRHSHCSRVEPAQRPKAQFVSDVTLADGLQVHAGETLNKVWSIKNIGTEPWPANTRLVFVGGDLAPESENRLTPDGALVPYAGVGDIVHVSINIQVPNEVGRFRSTFRLQTVDGLRFGPRIWIDLVVPEANASATTPTAAKTEPVAEKKAESSSPTVAAPKEEPKVELPVAEPVAAPVAKPATVPFQYTNQLAMLRSMGFSDYELCRYLLLNNNGDVQKVVDWLVANSPKL